jgi:hypothetical protein
MENISIFEVSGGEPRGKQLVQGDGPFRVLLLGQPRLAAQITQSASEKLFRLSGRLFRSFTILILIKCNTPTS